MDGSLPDSSVHEIFQTRVLEWAVISSPGDLPNTGIKPMTPASPALAGGFFTTEPPGKPFQHTDFVVDSAIVPLTTMEVTKNLQTGTRKDRNGMDLTETENIKKRWQEYKKNYTKKIFMTQITTMVLPLT